MTASTPTAPNSPQPNSPPPSSASPPPPAPAFTARRLHAAIFPSTDPQARSTLLVAGPVATVLANVPPGGCWRPVPASVHRAAEVPPLGQLVEHRIVAPPPPPRSPVIDSGPRGPKAPSPTPATPTAAIPAPTAVPTPKATAR